MCHIHDAIQTFVLIGGLSVNNDMSMSRVVLDTI